MTGIDRKGIAARFLKVFQWPSSESSPIRDPLRFWQERVLHALLVTSIFLGFLSVVPSVWLSIAERLYPVAFFDVAVYLLFVTMFLRKTLSYAFRATTISLSIYIVGLLLLLTLKASGAGPIWLFAFPVLTGVLLGYRAAMGAIALNGVTLIVIGVLLAGGSLSWAYPVENPVAKWVVVFFNFMLLNGLATVSLTTLLSGLQNALRQENVLRITLQEKHAELARSLQDLQKEAADKEQILKELKESDRKVLLLAENALDCIWQTDRELRITYVNPAVERILGFRPADWIGTRLTAFCSGTEMEDHSNAMIEELRPEGDRRAVLLETLFRHSGGHDVAVEILSKPLIDGAGTIVGLQGTMRDISERKSEERRRTELEAQIRQSQKIQSIGTLAGGIAHDFNNILASVVGYTELALLEVNKGTRLEEFLGEVYRAGMRAKDLVKQILAFSRQSEQEKKPLQVGLIASEVVKLLRSTVSTTIAITHRVAGTSLVMADETQIHQVLMNLCTNAAHAMEEKGGVLAVEVTEIQLDGFSPPIVPGLKQGGYIRIAVSDSGTGIDPGAIGSIFEPYFTTKESGRGTGLGLSVVHGIVKAHNGEITVESVVGKGTTFSVYLPLLKRGIEVHPEVVEEAPTGTERILLVDDEAPIVNAGRLILEHLGYRVTTALGSLEALDHFKRAPEGFDLVITDMNMPKMAGDRLARELLKIRPNVPIVICSGYSKKLSRETMAEIGLKGIVMKPYNKSQLARTVRSVLTGSI